MIAQYWDWNLLYLIGAMAFSALPVFVFLRRRRAAYDLAVIGVLLYLVMHAYRPSLSAEIDGFAIPGRDGQSLEYRIEIRPFLIFSGESFALILRPPRLALNSPAEPELSLGCKFEVEDGVRIPHGLQTMTFTESRGWILRRPDADHLSGWLSCDFVGPDSRMLRSKTNGALLVSQPIKIVYFSIYYRVFMYGLPVLCTIMNVFLICLRLRRVRERIAAAEKDPIK
ncbi:MAG: hypothetical protein NXI24_24695 [bacterium]|nr:hypothetical protein [bacterium]